MVSAGNPKGPGERAEDPKRRGARMRRAVAIAAAVSLAVLSACSSGSEGGDPDAITVYNGRSQDLIGPLLEQFTADTGIAVELRSASSGELSAQIITEGDASPADVFISQDAGALGALTKEGLLDVLPADLLGRIPAQFQADDGSWLGLSGRVRVVVYNPNLVASAPDTIEKVVAGEYAGGKIGYAPTNASWQSFVTGLRVLWGEDRAKQWLEQFAAQDPVAYEGNTQIRDAVDAGEIEIGLINHYYLYELIAEKGEANVTARNQFMAPGDPGGLVNTAGAGILVSSEKKDQAQQLIDYLSSTAAQEFFATETWEYPLVEGVAPPAGLPTLASLQPPVLDLSDLDSIAETQALLADVGLLTQ